VARLGDEFAILLENIQEISDATHLASRLQQELSLPLNLDGAVFCEHRHRPQYTDTTNRRTSCNADTAMYQAKTLGKARHEVFSKTCNGSNALAVGE